MKKSLCLETVFAEMPFEQRFEPAALAGFQYVEFWSWEDKDLPRIKQLCSGCGLRIAGFSGDGPHSMINPGENTAYIEWAERSMQIAHELGCGHLVLHSNALGPGGSVLNDYGDLSDSERFTAMVCVLKALAPIAERERITLVLEALNTEVDHPGNFLKSTRESARLVRLVDSPNVRLLYDVYHMQIMEGNVVNTLKRFIDCVGYIHVADVPGRHEPGTGEIHYPLVFRTLRGLGYDGFVGFELFPSRDSGRVARELLEL